LYSIPKFKLRLIYDKIVRKLNCKQFIRGQTFRLAYETWCLKTSDEQLLNFDFYQGISTKINIVYKNMFRKYAATTIKMLYKFLKEIQNLPYEFILIIFLLKLICLSFEKKWLSWCEKNRWPKNVPKSNQRLKLKIKT